MRIGKVLGLRVNKVRGHKPCHTAGFVSRLLRAVLCSVHSRLPILERDEEMADLSENEESPPILDRPEMYQEDTISHRLLEIAEHNMTTSLVGWIASACIMALDVYLSVVG